MKYLFLLLSNSIAQTRGETGFSNLFKELTQSNAAEISLYCIRWTLFLISFLHFVFKTISVAYFRKNEFDDFFHYEKGSVFRDKRTICLFFKIRGARANWMSVFAGMRFKSFEFFCSFSFFLENPRTTGYRACSFFYKKLLQKCSFYFKIIGRFWCFQ